MKTKLLVTLLACLTFTALIAADSPSVGSAAPDLSLTDSKGKTHTLSQYKGKYVVLEWFNPECPFVKKHYGGGNMQKLQEEFTGKASSGDLVPRAGMEAISCGAAPKENEEWKRNRPPF